MGTYGTCSPRTTASATSKSSQSADDLSSGRSSATTVRREQPLSRTVKIDRFCQRALALLLAHDGLVVAGPLDDVQRLIADGERDQALILCRRVKRDLAAIEALIPSDVIRFTGLRPALTALNRAAVLQVFGIDPSLTVFTNFLEAAHTVAELPWMFEQEFAPELLELYERLGLTARPHGSFDQAVASVH
jgi:hypothetical protein